MKEEHLGPAHILVRRCLVADRSIPEGAVRFEGPMRTPRACAAVGTALYGTRQSLRRLLTWPMHPKAPQQPDLAVVLVDADGDTGRKTRLEAWCSDRPVTKVIGVAIQEFEAWLIADIRALKGALNAAPRAPTHLESMKGREAKELFALWLRTHVPDRSEREIRMTLASTCELDEVAKRCSAFDVFRKELARS